MMKDISGGDANLVEILGELLEGDDSLGEFVGDDSLGDLLEGDDSGDDSGDDILGAVVQASRKRGSARKKEIAKLLLQKRLASGTLLQTRKPRSSREYALGLGSTTIAGNASANINVQPQVVFRPERLVIPSNLAQDFLLTDIKVGKNSQLASTGAVPAVAFTESAFGVRLKMDTAQISMYVTVSVTNQNAAARVFQGCLIGPAVE